MEENLNYWLLTTEYPPFFGGGISTYCRETVQMLTAGGYRVTVFLPDQSVSGITPQTQNNTRIIRFNPFDHPQKAFLGYETLVSFAFGQVLEKFIREEGSPKILESQEYNGIAYFTLLYKKLLYPSFTDLRVLITVHAPSFVCLPYNHVATYGIPYFWIGEMEKFCLKAADQVISPSEYMAAEIRRTAPEVQLDYTLIRNPFHLQGTETSRVDTIIEREFVFYGKASPLKGIFELLQQFRKLWAAGKDLTLRLLGGMNYYYHPEGKLMEEIIKTKYAEYIGNGQLILEGEIKPAELRKKLLTAHAVIIPSTVDNLPYATIECMALGKVLIISESGGHKELIRDGYSGFIFSHEDPDSFETKINQVLSLDRDSLEKTGKRAIEAVAEYCDPEKIFGRKRDLLNGMATRQKQSHIFPFLRQLPTSHSPAVDGASPSPVINGATPVISGVFPGKKGLLSVIIPYYNMGDYIEDTIRSIQDSTWPAIEIILVNDGSTEKASIDKLQQIATDHPSIKIINKTNEGLSLARNTGAFAANGEFMAYLDADDTVDRTYYEKALSILGNYNNVYFTGCWVSYFEHGSGTWPCFTPEAPWVLYHNMLNTSALVYKTEYFLQAGLNDRAMLFGMEDYDSLLSMLENGYSGVAIPEPLFNYRVRKGSMARQFTRKKIMYLYQILANKHNRFYSNFAAEISNLLNSNGPGYLYDNPSLDLHVAVGNKVIKKILGARGIAYIRRSKHLKKAIIQIQTVFKR